MQNISRSIILTAIILLLTGCEKIFHNYRYKYLGNWEFNYYSSVRTFPVDTISSDSSVYLGEIKAGKGKDEIIIIYGVQKSISLNVDKEGKITNYCFQPSHCSGHFDGDDFFIYEKSDRINSGSILRLYYKKISGIKAD